MKKKLLIGLAATVAVLIVIAHMCGVEGGDNVRWMHRIADIVIKYDTSQGSLPNSIDDALDVLKVTLPHRGDVNGRPLVYKRVSEHAFFLVAGLENTKENSNKNSRIAIFFVDGQEVSKTIFFEKVQGGIDGEVLQVYKGYVE